MDKIKTRGPGFEPGLTGPEPVVLPLDDPRKNKFKIPSPKFKSSPKFKCQKG